MIFPSLDEYGLTWQETVPGQRYEILHGDVRASVWRDGPWVFWVLVTQLGDDGGGVAVNDNDGVECAFEEALRRATAGLARHMDRFVADAINRLGGEE